MNELYFVVRCKDGEALRENGLFYGQCSPRAYDQLNAARDAAIAIAKYHHETMHVDNEFWETVMTINPNGEEVRA